MLLHKQEGVTRTTTLLHTITVAAHCSLKISATALLLIYSLFNFTDSGVTYKSIQHIRPGKTLHGREA
jgi:hypothetical protein